MTHTRPAPSECDHIFGPYFTRVPFKVYWLKCYRCLSRRGPFLTQAKLKMVGDRLRVGGDS